MSRFVPVCLVPVRSLFFLCVCLVALCAASVCAQSSGRPGEVLLESSSNQRWVSPSEVPPGTPPCGPKFVPLCVMDVPPSVAVGIKPYVPTAAQRSLSRELAVALSAPLDQTGGPRDTVRRFRAIQARHPEVWHAPPPLPKSGPVALCPSCAQPDGSRWQPLSPVLVSGHLLHRWPMFWPAPFRRPLGYYLCWIGFVAVLGAMGVYYGTKLVQARAHRRHVAAVALRRQRAVARASASPVRRG